MKRMTDMKFRHKLVLSFTILTLFPMMVFGFYSYQIASSNLEEKTRSFGENITKDVNTKYDNLIHEAATVTRYMIGSQDLESLFKKRYSSYEYPLYEKTQDLKSYKFHMNHIMNLYPEMDYLVIIPLNQPYLIGHSNRGNTFFSDNNQYDDKQWYKKTIEADGYWEYTGIHKEDQIEGSRSVISISRLIKDSQTQEALAVVKVMIDRKSLEDLLNIQEKNGDFTFLLKDEENQSIGKSSKFPGSLVEKLDHPKSIDAVTANSDSIISHSASDLTGWDLYAVINKGIVFKELDLIKSGLLILVIITFIISLVLAYLLSSNLVRPLEKLKDSMNQDMGRKWSRLELEDRNDEIGDLTKNYNKMLTRLDNYVKLIIKKEKQKKDLEYKSLQAQINPHFLYNTLNTIKWCAYLDKPDLVNRMIESLVFILRFISKRNDDMIQISEEREFLEHYIDIMKIRFEDEFEIKWEISDDIKDCQLPILLLQPIVENAIVYGMEKEDGDHLVWLKGYRQGGRLKIEIEDNGIGFEEKPASKGAKFSSIGLRNVKERVNLIYGKEGELTIMSVPDKGTRVILDLPCQLKNDSEG